MYSRNLPEFSPIPKPSPHPEFRPAPPPPQIPGQPKRRTRGRNKLKKEAFKPEETFPWSNPEEDFLTRLLTKIEAMIEVDGERLTWRKDIHENFPEYRPLPSPGTVVPHLYLRDAAWMLHKFSPLQIRFAYFRRRFPHDVRLLDEGQNVLSSGAAARYWEDEKLGVPPRGRSRVRDYSLGNLTQARYPMVEHRPLISKRNRSGFMRITPIDPLVWKYHERYRPCYVDLIQYKEPHSIVRICPHNYWQYKGDTECEIEWQRMDAEIRGDILRTNLEPGMFIKVLSRNLGAMSVKGYTRLDILPTIYGEKELRGPEDFTYDEGWLKIKGGRPRRMPHRDGRRLPNRKPEDQPDLPSHNPSAQNFSPVAGPEADRGFDEALWRTIEDGSFYPPGYQPDPRYAPRFYAVDPLKLGLHPWLAEEIRLRELEFAKEL